MKGEVKEENYIYESSTPTELFSLAGHASGRRMEFFSKENKQKTNKQTKT